MARRVSGPRLSRLDLENLKYKPRKKPNDTKGRGFAGFFQLSDSGQACDSANSAFLVLFVTFVVSSSVFIPQSVRCFPQKRAGKPALP
jgi:hypothetical protein